MFRVSRWEDLGGTEYHQIMVNVLNQ